MGRREVTIIPEAFFLLFPTFGGLIMNMKQRRISRRLLVIGMLAAALLLTGCGKLEDEITVEAGSPSIDANTFLKKDEGENVTFVTDPGAIDLSVPGDYTVEVSYQGKTYERTVKVRDTVAPTGQVQNLSAYSTGTVTPEDFLVSVTDMTAVTAAFQSEPDMSREGSQVVVIVLTDAGGNTCQLQAALTVFVDSEAPVLSGVTELRSYMGTEPDYLTGVTATDNMDPAPTITVDDSGADLNTPGTYTVTYIARDEAGNESTQEATLTVTDDNTPPVISCPGSMTVYQGGTVSYRSGVTVTDDKDPNPTLSIDSAGVDVSTIGSYTVAYTATDASGNVSIVEVTVNVVEAPVGYASEDVINEMADKLIAKIITDDMTDRQKVVAIYNHMRSSYGYSGSSDKSDWMQGAYAMMKNGLGDCFNYYALSKLLLERLGIANIDVVKVKNYDGDSSHYWSLVSVDGGATYYHFDSTPRVGSGDDFCLVTDAFLDAYSEAHGNCHNRDTSLYPATPNE